MIRHVVYHLLTQAWTTPRSAGRAAEDETGRLIRYPSRTTRSRASAV